MAAGSSSLGRSGCRRRAGARASPPLADRASLPRTWGFTEGKCSGTRQRVFAEGLTLGKEQPSAKTLCRGPDPRQTQAHGNNNYLSVRPSATPPDTTLIPCRQSLPRASPLGPRQRLFNRFWKFSFKKAVAECPWTSTRQRQSLSSAKLALGKFSIFFVFFTPNFLLGPPTLFTTSCSNLVIFLVFLLYLVD